MFKLKTIIALKVSCFPFQISQCHKKQMKQPDNFSVIARTVTRDCFNRGRKEKKSTCINQEIKLAESVVTVLDFIVWFSNLILFSIF